MNHTPRILEIEASSLLSNPAGSEVYITFAPALLESLSLSHSLSLSLPLSRSVSLCLSLLRRSFSVP